MIKIKCIICGDIGYSAAPQAVVCKCGGSFRVMRWKEKETLTAYKDTFYLYKPVVISELDVMVEKAAS